MEVHMGKRYRLISIGRYRHLRETLKFHNSKTVKAREPNFIRKEIGLRTIANDQENPDPRQVVYTELHQIWVLNKR